MAYLQAVSTTYVRFVHCVVGTACIYTIFLNFYPPEFEVSFL